MDYDLHHNSKSITAVTTQAVGVGTAIGETIDMLGFESIEYLVTAGALTTGTWTVSLEHSDTVDAQDPPVMTNAVAVPAELVLGNTWNFDAANDAPADDDVTKRVGCISKKRFQRVSITGVGTGGTNNFTISALLSNPEVAPIADSPNGAVA